MLAFAGLGCAGPTSEYLAYAGTGSVQTSGEAAADLGHQEVQVRMCNASDERMSFAVIAVGQGCVVGANRTGGALVGWPETTCTLWVDGRVHQLRVTDALATFAESALLTKHGLVTTVNEGVITVQIGGDERDGAGGVRHSLFLFEGPMVRTGDAEDWCLGVLARPAPPPSVKPSKPRTDLDETEANGF